jgi:hypothetical protein
MSSPAAGDPATQVILGVISNGLYEFGRRLFERVDKHGPLTLDGAHGAAAGVAIDLAVEQLTEVEEIRTEIGGERLREFLRSPELTQLGHQVFAFRLNMASLTSQEQDDPTTDMERLERAFIRSLQLWTGLSNQAADAHGKRLFAAFLKACDDGLATLVNDKVLAAHDLNSAMNTQLVLSELSNLNQNLELQLRPDLDVSAILDFERRYRRQVADRDTTISLPSLDRRVTFPVDRMYVKPTLTEPGSDPSDLPYDALLPLVNGTVVLGDPGGGKSTLISKLIQDIASGRTDETRMPILVVLREYAAEKDATGGGSLIQHVEAKAESRYQIPDVPPGAVEYLLRNNRAVVLFDGLDELLDTSDRLAIAGDIESFRNLFPTVPVLVTSRKVGYEEAPLRPGRFRLLKLGDLDEAQIADYTRRTVELHSTVPDDRRSSLCADFMAKSSTLTDLRANPLLLGLLLERYVKTLNLPAHRVAVIESCALLLFERWDSDRGILVKFPFESKLKPAVSHLAHHIYTDIQLPQGATERWLVSATVNFLVGRKYEDPAEATAEAQEFVALCSGRTWVFSAAGLNAGGEELFKFTHRTFMEYFVAAHLNRTLPEPNQLLPFIRPRVEAQEWHEVCQLAVHMLARDREGGADAVFEGLIPKTAEIKHNEMNQVVFCTRALASLVPDRLDTIKVFVRSWLLALERAATTTTVNESHQPLLSLLDPFVNSHSENQVTLSRNLPHIFAEVLPGRYAPARMAWVFEVAVNLPRLLRPHADEAAHEAWSVASEQIALSCGDQLDEMAQDGFTFQCSRFFHGQVSLTEFLGAFGMGGLLAERPLGAIMGDPLGRDLLPSLAESVIRAACHRGSGKSRVREHHWALSALDEIGRKISTHAPIPGEPDTRWQLPILSDARRPHAAFARISGSALNSPVSEWGTKQIFSASCLLLSLYEQGQSEAPASLEGFGDETLLGLVGALLEERDSGEGHQAQHPLLEKLESDQRSLLRRWSAGALSFTLSREESMSQRS